MNKIKEYIKCARPHSFPAAVAPVLVGSTFALLYIEKFSFSRFFIFLLACILIQAATNNFNEYYDYKKGLDKIDSQGIAGSILKGNLTEREVLYSAIAYYGVALILGIYLASKTSYSILILGLVCMLVGYLYTGGKKPIAYGPFGEVVSGFFMGTIIIGLAFFIQTDFVNLEVVLISIPLFIMIGNILLANSIRDMENDRASGRRTLAILLGKKNSLKFMAISFGIVYLFNVLIIFTSIAEIYNLLVLITIPVALKILEGFVNNKSKETMQPFMVLTAKLTIMIGLLMSIANVLNYYI